MGIVACAMASAYASAVEGLLMGFSGTAAFSLLVTIGTVVSLALAVRMTWSGDARPV